MEQANVRSGPGTDTGDYHVSPGYQSAPARPEFLGTWLLVRRPEDSRKGWMALTTVRTSSDVASLPEVAAPPTNASANTTAYGHPFTYGYGGPASDVNAIRVEAAPTDACSTRANACPAVMATFSE